MNYPHLAYMITEGYCALYAITVFFRLNGAIGSQREVRDLRNMIFAYLGMLVSDILCYLYEDGIWVMPSWLYLTFFCLTVVFITYGCYFWFRFVEDRLYPSRAHYKRDLYLFLIPALLISIADLLSIPTGIFFYFDEQGVFQDTLVYEVLQMVVNYFYLAIPTVLSVYRAFRTHSRIERAEYWTYAVYMIAPLTAGFLETYLPTVPILALNIFLIIHILFLMIQNMQIYNDALTNLNNRRHLNQYLDERLPKATPERPLFIYMIDINGFKAINDTYGHVIGDHGLREFAIALQDVANSCYGFPARYGGDEFTLVVEGKKGQKVEEFAKAIQDTFSTQQSKKPKNSPDPVISVSIGYVSVTAPDIKLEDALAIADKMLYEQKQAWHESHDGSVSAI
jgi:diguanylate cyclase (GGDEF)-like protein